MSKVTVKELEIVIAELKETVAALEERVVKLENRGTRIPRAYETPKCAVCGEPNCTVNHKVGQCPICNAPAGRKHGWYWNHEQKSSILCCNGDVNQ